MANILSREKQIAVIGALAEGSSIRSIERLPRVHGDTIGRLAIRVGKAYARISANTAVRAAIASGAQK